MNYWVIPGTKTISVFEKLHLKRNAINEPYIKIEPRGHRCYISSSCIKLMNADVADKIYFLQIGKDLFVCKSLYRGTLIKQNGGIYASSVRSFSSFCKKTFKTGSAFKCGVVETKSEFYGEKILKLKLPPTYNAIMNKLYN